MKRIQGQHLQIDYRDAIVDNKPVQYGGVSDIADNTVRRAVVSVEQSRPLSFSCVRIGALTYPPQRQPWKACEIHVATAFRLLDTVVGHWRKTRYYRTAADQNLRRATYRLFCAHQFRVGVQTSVLFIPRFGCVVCPKFVPYVRGTLTVLFGYSLKRRS